MKTFKLLALVAALAPIRGEALAESRSGYPSGGFRYTFRGDPADRVVAPRAGIAMLGGGEDLDAAFRWLVKRANGGDFLTLRAQGRDEDYDDYVRSLGAVDSAETLDIHGVEANRSGLVLRKIRQAEAIFLAGGDQSLYMRFFTGRAIGDELRRAVERGVPIGGTSAGLAVLGEVVFAASRDSIGSTEALADPHDPRVTLVTGFLGLPWLRGILTDTHFTERERLGRLVAFTARSREDGRRVLGLGVDEEVAVLVDAHGKGRVIGRGNVWGVGLTRRADTCRRGRPLTCFFDAFRWSPGDMIDFSRRPLRAPWRGTGRVVRGRLEVESGRE